MNDAPDTTVLLRIIDANYNRALEGLRVIEEYLRLAMEDRYLTEMCKGLRHDLVSAISRISVSRLHQCRETLTDIGTEIGTPSEYRRHDAASVFTANLKRLQQSLRCLEEYVKVMHPPTAELVEPLRYRAYTLEKAITISITSHRCLEDRVLYVLIDGGATMDQFEKLVDSLVKARVPILQLRDKKLDDRRLLQRSRWLRDRTRQTNTLLIINDRPDIAVLAGADGVHVGQDELTVTQVRRIVGPDRLIGVSTHSIQQARQAVLDGASYIGVGPIFPSRTKAFHRFQGIKLLNEVNEEIGLPAFAIGGILPDNLDDILDTGFRRIAVSQAVISSSDPGRAASQLLIRLTSHQATSPSSTTR